MAAPLLPALHRLFVAVALLVLFFLNIFHATTTQKTNTSCEEDRGSLVHQFATKERPTRANQKRLEFVHVPKTGGSSIEKATSEQGISWGICKFLGFNLSDFNSKGAIQCPDTNITAIKWVKDFPGIIPANCLGWHLPSYFFDNLAPDYHPFYNATLFAIVRDPYERLLSEYYYRAKNVLHWNDSMINSAGNMNGWLTKRIKSRIDFINHPYPWKEPSYCFAQGHFIPQRKFIYQGDRKVVDHVLRFENLREEFDGLMKLYGLLNVSLPEQHTFKSNKTMGVKDFTNRTRQLIEQVYEEDFVTFDYPYYAGR